MACSISSFDTEWMSRHLRLPHRIVEKVLWTLKEEKQLEILGQAGPLNYRYRATSAAVDLSKRLHDICGYMGPVPVSIEEYVSAIDAQRKRASVVTLDDVSSALEELTLPKTAVQIAALALSSNRSLFVFGPSGNGKSTLGRILHRAVQTPIRIPYAISVGSQVIRLFDPQCHSPLVTDTEDPAGDKRWVLIESPFVRVGGELTMKDLDPVFDVATNCYEAPPHMKANCGTYFIDDLGRQRVPTVDLLNRWILPLEQQIDYLTLNNGAKIEIPFRMMLIVATNLKVSDVADQAFLRRMGYRIHLDAPTEAGYRTILKNKAAELGLEMQKEIEDFIIARYQNENREWRGSEPRDLLSRCIDYLELYAKSNRVITEDMLDTVWHGYFAENSDK